MLYEQSLVIDAPREEVWEFITDLKAFAECIPGCEEAELKDSNTLLATISVKIAFLTMRFRVEGTMCNLRPPEHLEAIAKGTELGLAGALQMRNTVDLEALSPEQTRLNYKVDVSLFGKLGSLGAPVARAKANQIAAEFGENLRRNIMARRAAKIA